jgi:hypothetical protein
MGRKWKDLVRSGGALPPGQASKCRAGWESRNVDRMQNTEANIRLAPRSMHAASATQVVIAARPCHEVRTMGNVCMKGDDGEQACGEGNCKE